MRPLNRVTPAMPARLMQSYELRAPITTHRRSATCAEVECAGWARGWQSVIDVSTVLGQQQARYIRMHSGRAFTASGLGDLITFVFAPGQQCFDRHTTTLEREPFLIVRGGDWRGNPTGFTRTHVRLTDWVDDFATHQLQIAEQIEKG